MSIYADKAHMHARGDGIEMTLSSDDVFMDLVLPNEALWNLVEFIAEKAPQQLEMIKRIIQEADE